MTKLVLVEDLKTERIEQDDDTPKAGEWYWVAEAKTKEVADAKADDDEIEEDPYDVATSGYDRKHRYDEPGKRWLACVVHVGSNYAKVEGVYLSNRISLDSFHKTCTRELDPQAYVKRRIGSAQTNVTYGQQAAWKTWMAEEYDRKNGWRRYQNEWHFSPGNNPGPGRVAKITRLTSRGASFSWTKKADRAKRVPSRPGWTKLDYGYKVNTSFTCPVADLFNVTAYTPGDFHLFFDDPRTRAEYLQWAPYLLTAEDFHAGKIKLAKDKAVDEDEDSESGDE